MNMDETTPQGQLCVAETAEIENKNADVLTYVAGVDPATSSGRMQDGIARIYFLTRNPAQPTTVFCDCVGLAGTVIPAGALARDTDGNVYSCVSGGTIPIGGTISLQFANTVTGPVPCAATTLNQLYQQVTGWESVNNPLDGVIGSNVETATEFEQRREATVAANANGTLPAIRGSVLSVPGVQDCYVTDNSTGAPVTVGGVTLPAGVLYVCVAGGNTTSVAQAIWKKKSPGCPYFAGNTSVTIYDTLSGLAVPPAYVVTFNEAATLPLVMTVQILNSSNVPSNAAALIQAAILNAFSGGDGGPSPKIGSTQYSGRYYAAVAALGEWAELAEILLGTSNSPSATLTGASISGTTLTATVATGSLAIGDTIQGVGVVDGTQIVSGTGPWVINNSQTVASEAMVGVRPTAGKATININQIPALTAPNITLALV